MKSIWHDVNRLSEKYATESEFSDVSLDDFVLDTLSEESSLDTLLLDCGLTYEQALSKMIEDAEYYKELAKRCGLTEDKFQAPFVWAEIVGLCKDEMTAERLEMLIWLMSGGRLCEKQDEELDENFYVWRWLGVRKRVLEFSEFFNGIAAKLPEFASVLSEIERIKKTPSCTGDEAECEHVFAMLCDNSFVYDNADLEILRNNLIALSELISAHKFLEKLKPLVFFQAYVKHTKKLFFKSDFIPNLKKLFERKEYSIGHDNGKNYKQFAEYCDLYVRMKSCFPNADYTLCDAGFLYCSNLADWYYSLGAMGYECDIQEGIPFTIEAAVCEMCVSCFDEPLSLDFIGNSELFESQRAKYPVLQRKAEKAAEAIRFDELREFAEDSVGFCEKLFTEEYAVSVNAGNHDAAWGILVRAVERKFDELLENEIISILYDSIKM
ncbi:MAG: hypothetical protein ACI4JY_10640 [Oscillospiraceae bacterium]